MTGAVTGTTHIIGAGVAGLAAAVALAKSGKNVVLYEATKHAGGRCRSFFDTGLQQTIDNGNHAVLGGNPNVFEYLDIIDARDELIPVGTSGHIPFVDLASDDRWTLEPGNNRFPSWIFNPLCRARGTTASDYLRGLNLMFAGQSKSVADCLPQTGSGWRNFWEPLSTAVMNAPSSSASAYLLGRSLRNIMLSQAGGLRSYIPRSTLAKTFITPALKHLEKLGATAVFGSPLIKVFGKTRAEHLEFRGAQTSLEPNDIVILAVPPWSPVVQSFLPKGFSPKPSPIVNAHFHMNAPEATTSMTGVIGGRAQWIFTRPNLVSVTVSGDTALAAQSQDAIAEILWTDIQKSMNLTSAPRPAGRVIIERRATPLQDSAFVKHRPNSETSLANVFLAGDWINTGLPCTLESAVKSGFNTAKLATKSH